MPDIFPTIYNIFPTTSDIFQLQIRRRNSREEIVVKSGGTKKKYSYLNVQPFLKVTNQPILTNAGTIY